LTNSDTNKIDKTQVNRLGFLFKIKSILSFLWPIRIEHTCAEGEYLELSLFQGQRLLNTKHANYSNGNLQLAYKRLFKEVDLQLEKRNKVLVLGFGFGGVVRLIGKVNKSAHILGVESNETVLNWYRRYCKQLHNVTLEHLNAEVFMANNNDKYDLIICDIYVDLDVPGYFQSMVFLKQLKRCLNQSGLIIFNKVVKNEQHTKEYNQLMLDMSSLFKHVHVNTQFELNRFILAE
jgi:spermidine synthase